MAIGDRMTRPGHVQYGDLLLGPGTAYRWRNLAGWDDMPPLDSGTVPRSDTHGAFPGQLLAQARTITVEGLMVRAPRATIGAAVGALNAGTAPAVDERPLVVWLDERGPLLTYARATRRAIPTGPGHRVGTIMGAALEFVATDSRRYGLTEHVAPATLPASEPGLEWAAAPVQVLAAEQAAGAAPVWQWWSNGDPVIAAAGTVATVRPLAEGAQLVWSHPSSDYGWPVSSGTEVTFTTALAGAQGVTPALAWWDAAGTYLLETAGVPGQGTFTATAPDGAAYVQPTATFAAALPAAVPIGLSALLIMGSSGTASWPLEFGAPGSTGALSVTNRGDAETHPIIEFRGPVTRPALTNLATGDVLEYDLPLAAGDVLTIDTRAGTVLLNGTASRIDAVTARSVPEQTFTLAPGTTNLTFRAAPGSADPAASATVRYRSAYW
ncbi:hypothetical protein AB0L80_02390 [Streptomyces sp. NPDC052069]|uniref:phage distal tail protein n=1 Tax=Streptomyces sp. NPDC052069 TaxID=3154650 RepID=UPI003439A84C